MVSTEQDIKDGTSKITALYRAAKQQESVQRLTDMLDEAYITGKPGDKFFLDMRLNAALADMWFDGYSRGMDWEQTK